MTNEPKKVSITASDINLLLENGDPIDSLDTTLNEIVEAFQPGAGGEVTLTVTIKNDLESDEDEEEKADEE